MALWSNTDTNAAKPKYIGNIVVSDVLITAGGTGYTTATVTFSAPSAGGVTATGTVTLNAGAVDSVTITEPGSGYTINDTITATFGGDGTGATGTVSVDGPNLNGSVLVFVSREESQVASNRAKGLLSPGWWLYKTYVDGNANTRHKAELLVAMDVINAVSGDADDDAVVADV